MTPEERAAIRKRATDEHYAADVLADDVFAVLDALVEAEAELDDAEAELDEWKRDYGRAAAENALLRERIDLAERASVANRSRANKKAAKTVTVQEENARLRAAIKRVRVYIEERESASRKAGAWRPVLVDATQVLAAIEVTP